MTHAYDPDHPGFNIPQRQKLEILLAILLALFLFALDQTVVGTALPIISIRSIRSICACRTGCPRMPQVINLKRICSFATTRACNNSSTCLHS